jgi:hypothetical protein
MLLVCGKHVIILHIFCNLDDLTMDIMGTRNHGALDTVRELRDMD